MPIDGLIGFAGSEVGAKLFGADVAKKVWLTLRKLKKQEQNIVIAQLAQLVQQSWRKRLKC